MLLPFVAIGMLVLAVSATVQSVANDPAFWERMLERAGLPLVLLVLIGVVVLRIARWIRPHLDDLVRSHLNTMKSLVDLLSSMKDEQRRQADAVEKLASAQDQSRTDFMEFTDRVVDRLDQIAARGSP